MSDNMSADSELLVPMSNTVNLLLVRFNVTRLLFLPMSKLVILLHDRYSYRMLLLLPTLNYHSLLFPLTVILRREGKSEISMTYKLLSLTSKP
mgnify:CR=1 FL=1